MNNQYELLLREELLHVADEEEAYETIQDFKKEVIDNFKVKIIDKLIDMECIFSPVKCEDGVTRLKRFAEISKVNKIMNEVKL